jgi:hypothetical protein
MKKEIKHYHHITTKPVQNAVPNTKTTKTP